VPNGAEMPLATRLLYLSAEQRRIVLKTTALASGYCRFTTITLDGHALTPTYTDTGLAFHIVD
jgi:hypothetical protein